VDSQSRFETQHIITFKVGLSPSATKTAENTRISYQQLLRRIRQIPGVQAADLTVLVPLGQHVNLGPFWVGSQKPASMAEAPRALYYWTGPDHLRTMEIPLLRGRYFTPEDTTKSDPVVVIDSVLAHRYFPDKDPVGQAMMVPHWGPVRVIGVVGHVRHWGLDAHDPYTENQIYAPLYQLPDQCMPNFYQEITCTVRTPLALATVLPAIKAAIYGAGSDQTVYALQTMQQLVSESMTSQRLPMMLLGTFAGLALLLASVGIYGVISYSVSQRVQEIGIRMALGAKKWDVFRMVIGLGLRLAVAGLVIGGVASLVAGRLLSTFSHLLYGVGVNDPVTFLGVSLALTGVAILACYIPARRATSVDPMQALRTE
jgi:predicted permease